MENKSLESLIQLVISDLESRGYSPGTVEVRQGMFNRLHRYCDSITVTEYSESIGQQFVEYVKRCNPTMSITTLYHYTGNIKRLNCVLNGKEWRQGGNPKKEYTKSCYNNLVSEYENYLMRIGKPKNNIRSSMFMLTDFLAFAERYGCSQMNEFTAEVILVGFERATSKTVFRQAVGAFLQYAYNRTMTDSNLRHLIPIVARHHGVPSVYSPDEVEQLLASIDRTTVIGKRDYAVVLIAARLGLRASDIANLKFDNLKTGKIEIIQVKTKQPLTTVLSDEIKAAILDYVDHGRQQSPEANVFLHKGGFGAVKSITISDITQKAFIKSGINIGNRKIGPHTLRASLATALLSEGNDYPTIQKVLGQDKIQSTKYYAKANVEQLRTNAIPVPPPSGNFAALLRGEVCM